MSQQNVQSKNNKFFSIGILNAFLVIGITFTLLLPGLATFYLIILGPLIAIGSVILDIYSRYKEARNV